MITSGCCNFDYIGVDIENVKYGDCIAPPADATDQFAARYKHPFSTARALGVNGRVFIARLGSYITGGIPWFTYSPRVGEYYDYRRYTDGPGYLFTTQAGNCVWVITRCCDLSNGYVYSEGASGCAKMYTAYALEVWYPDSGPATVSIFGVGSLFSDAGIPYTYCDGGFRWGGRKRYYQELFRATFDPATDWPIATDGPINDIVLANDYAATDVGTPLSTDPVINWHLDYMVCGAEGTITIHPPAPLTLRSHTTSPILTPVSSPTDCEYPAHAEEDPPPGDPPDPPPDDDGPPGGGGTDGNTYTRDPPGLPMDPPPISDLPPLHRQLTHCFGDDTWDGDWVREDTQLGPNDAGLPTDTLARVLHKDGGCYMLGSPQPLPVGATLIPVPFDTLNDCDSGPCAPPICNNDTAQVDDASSSIIYFCDGADIPAGNYLVSYLDGAINIDTVVETRWVTHVQLVYGATDERICYFGRHSTSSAAISAATGYNTTIDHAGGPVGVYFNDSKYTDNESAPPSPTFQISEAV